MARVRVLAAFKANINEAVQKVDRAMKRRGYVKVEENLVSFLVSLKDFMPSPALLMRATFNYRDPLKSYQLISQPSFDIINELESLNQIGLSCIYVLDTFSFLGAFISMISSHLYRA
ncbi:hypothetical protein ILYODFUR_034994 [Ilyodon furcidens]|uniref:Uncharacterized protein n=1 Tax=Ilyodon furcidens TaxID=33524 RepID=A0ABV0SV95_9TELE